MRSRPKQGSVPEEIPDAEHELVIERVCAVDVAKASGTVCVRTPRERRRVSKVWDVQATTGAVTDLADQLIELGVEKVTVESSPTRGWSPRSSTGSRSTHTFSKREPTPIGCAHPRPPRDGSEQGERGDDARSPKHRATASLTDMVSGSALLINSTGRVARGIPVAVCVLARISRWAPQRDHWRAPRSGTRLACCGSVRGHVR